MQNISNYFSVVTTGGLNYVQDSVTCDCLFVQPPHPPSVTRGSLEMYYKDYCLLVEVQRLEDGAAFIFRAKE